MNSPASAARPGDPYDPATFDEAHVLAEPGVTGWLARRRKARLVEFTRPRPDDRAPLAFLDVGCGYGDVMADLDGFTVGIDINATALRQARSANPAGRLVLGNVDRLPFPAATFDRVICTEVLEHVDDPAGLARELWRVLRPGGRCAVSVPNEWVTTAGRFILGKRPCKSPAHKTAFSWRTLRALFPAPPLRRANIPFQPVPFILSSNLVALFEKARD